jgi:hypothetical protein
MRDSSLGTIKFEAGSTSFTAAGARLAGAELGGQVGTNEEVKKILSSNINLALRTYEDEEGGISAGVRNSFEDIATKEGKGDELLNAWRNLERTQNEEAKAIMKEIIELERFASTVDH